MNGSAAISTHPHRRPTQTAHSSFAAALATTSESSEEADGERPVAAWAPNPWQRLRSLWRQHKHAMKFGKRFKEAQKAHLVYIDYKVRCLDLPCHSAAGIL